MGSRSRFERGRRGASRRESTREIHAHIPSRLLRHRGELARDDGDARPRRPRRRRGAPPVGAVAAVSNRRRAQRRRGVVRTADEQHARRGRVRRARALQHAVALRRHRSRDRVDEEPHRGAGEERRGARQRRVDGIQPGRRARDGGGGERDGVVPRARRRRVPPRVPPDHEERVGLIALVVRARVAAAGVDMPGRAGRRRAEGVGIRGGGASARAAAAARGRGRGRVRGRRAGAGERGHGARAERGRRVAGEVVAAGGVRGERGSERRRVPVSGAASTVMSL
eukprot:31304-Pelagococcus_subviridis.AAC.14